MGRTPAVQLAPGVWRIPTAPDGQVIDVGGALRGFLCDKAGTP